MKRAFRPDDPLDAMAESFRLQVVDMILEAGKVAIFRDLPNDKKLVAFMAGGLTGIIGACMCFAPEEHRDGLFDEIVRFLPEARAHAEEIAKGAAS